MTVTATLPHHPLQHRRGELTAGDLRLAQLAFEGGAAGEEFVHFGDDAFLFGEGWEGEDKIFLILPESVVGKKKEAI